MILYSIVESVIDIQQEGSVTSFWEAWLPPVLTFLGVILTVVINYCMNKKNIEQTNKIHKESISTQYITDKRVDWIYAFREELANFLGIVNQYKNQRIYQKSFDQTENGLRSKLEISYSKLLLFLNFSGDIDKIIMNNLDYIFETVCKLNPYATKRRTKKFRKPTRPVGENVELLKKHIEWLMIHAQIYLKLEWNRVKGEAELNTWGEKVMNDEMLKLYKSAVGSFEISKDTNYRDEEYKPCGVKEFLDDKCVLKKQKAEATQSG